MSKEVTKENKYRTKTERLENSKTKLRGYPIELFMPVSTTDGANNLPAVVYVKVAGEIEGMRDLQDIKAVMHEKNIVGKVIPMRKAGLSICRQPLTVMSFVEPKDDIDDPEVA